MKASATTLLLLCVILLANNTSAQSIIYTSPKPNSSFVSLSSNIIIRCDHKFDISSITPDKFLVEGSLSGVHSGTIRVADDQKTILFTPVEQFSANEEVSVKVSSGMLTTDNEPVAGLFFKFKTTKLLQSIDVSSTLSEDPSSSTSSVSAAKKTEISTSSLDTIPTNFPTITIGTSNNPSDDKIFIANEPKGTASASIGNYLMILNNDGSPVAYKSLSAAPNLFKMESNGQLSYNLKANGQRYILDTTLSIVDTINCGNGYKANGHDGCLLPNGHALMFGNDPQPIDMSQIVDGGNPNATVTGSIIQEIDQSGNVVFQWRSWDYL